MSNITATLYNTYILIGVNEVEVTCMQNGHYMKTWQFQSQTDHYAFHKYSELSCCV